MGSLLFFQRLVHPDPIGDVYFFPPEIEGGKNGKGLPFFDLLRKTGQDKGPDRFPQGLSASVGPLADPFQERLFQHDGSSDIHDASSIL